MMKTALLGALAAGFLLTSAPANAQFSTGSLFSGGPPWANTFPFNSTAAQDRIFDALNPSEDRGVNASRPPGTENLTKTANKAIFRFFGVSKFTYFFGLR